MYGGFLAKTALSVAVDQQMAAEILALLIRDKGKRMAIAEKAKKHVRDIYDWSHIIPQHEALWKDLAARRRAVRRTTKRALWTSVLPQAPDPFTMYAAYPSRALDESGKLAVIASMDTIKLLWGHEINVLALDVMLSAEETTALIKHVSQGETSIGNLFRAFPALERPRLWRTIGWLIKLGILGYRAG
jgi:hypothetical protein